MTPKERDAIRARAEAATPGPWVNGSDEIFQSNASIFPAPIVISRIPGREKYPDNNDAEFIAHAPQDVLALLDALEAAEARAERTCDVRWDDCNPYMDNANDSWEAYCGHCDFYLQDYDEYTFCPGCGARIIKPEDLCPGCGNVECDCTGTELVEVLHEEEDQL